MFYGTFSWTRYSYRGDLTKMTTEQFQALRVLEEHQFSHVLQQISTSRWQAFREEHRWLLWIAGAACISLLLALAVPGFGIAAFLGWVCVLSLAFSAGSQALAVNRERRFLTRAYRRARRSSTFEEFRGIAVDNSDTIPAFETGSFPLLERISYFAAPPYPTLAFVDKFLRDAAEKGLTSEQLAKLRTSLESEVYDSRLASSSPVPPTKIDALVCDLWTLVTTDLDCRATTPAQLTSEDVRRAVMIYEHTSWNNIRGFRPWTHYNFLSGLTRDERETLAMEAYNYMLSIGIRRGS